ncbi:MAG: hypothetical protein ACXVHB_26375 [Solirubrobacteraceae bacterium]
MTVITCCTRSHVGLGASLLAVAVVGCGGAHKASNQRPIAQQQVTRAVRSYLQAQTAGDGQAACPLLTAGGQQRLTALVMQASKGLLKTRPSCEDAVGLIRGLAGPSFLARSRRLGSSMCRSPAAAPPPRSSTACNSRPSTSRLRR